MKKNAKIELHWENLPDGTRGCVGEAIEAGTGRVLFREPVLLPSEELPTTGSSMVIQTN